MTAIKKVAGNNRAGRIEAFPLDDDPHDIVRTQPLAVP
jgi:hypothetical protein